MQIDEQGFYKAYNFESNCNGCGHCKIVCPALHKDHQTPLKIIAFQHSDDDILMQSASGGAFSILAEHYLGKDGVVYGVTISDDMCAKYCRIDHMNDLPLIRNSKYIDVDPSNIGESLKKDADMDRPILFVGLPCTVAGMRRLVKHRPNVLWVDLLCFGKPSSQVWRLWIKRYGKIENLQFKDKRNGISAWGISFTKKATGRQVFLTRKSCEPIHEWLRGYNLSSQCRTCRFHGFERSGDISLGDFWGIKRVISDIDPAIIDNGISMVLFNNQKALQYVDLFGDGCLAEVDSSFEELAQDNMGLSTPSVKEKKSFKQKLFSLFK